MLVVGIGIAAVYQAIKRILDKVDLGPVLRMISPILTVA